MVFAKKECFVFAWNWSGYDFCWKMNLEFNGKLFDWLYWFNLIFIYFLEANRNTCLGRSNLFPIDLYVWEELCLFPTDITLRESYVYEYKR